MRTTIFYSPLCGMAAGRDQISPEGTMKIYSIEVVTDLGRRVVKLEVPLSVDPSGGMPPHFRALTEMLWGVVHEVASQGPVLGASSPKAEA